MHALTTGDIDKLMSSLSQDAVLYTDGGGKIKASPLPIQGSAGITRFLGRFQAFAPAGLSYKIAVVNGGPGVVMHANGKPYGVITFQVEQDRIGGIYTVVNPDKLGSVY